MNHGVSTNEFRGCGLFDGKSKCPDVVRVDRGDREVASIYAFLLKQVHCKPQGASDS